MTFGSSFGRTFSPTFQPSSQAAASGLNIIDTFTRSNGTLNNSTTEDGAFTWSASSSWSISSNAVINNPTLGSELIKNGGFDSDTEWTKGNGWSISGGTANYAAGSGNTYLTQTTPNTSRNKLVYADITKIAGSYIMKVGNREAPLTGVSPANIFTTNNNDAITLWAGPWGAATLDNFTAKPYSFADIFAAIDTGYSDVTLTANITTTSKLIYSGVVLNLDSVSNPQNFIAITPYQSNNGANRILLIKYVSGAIADYKDYSCGTTIGTKDLVVTKSGTNYAITYGSTSIVSNYSATNASLTNNELHGMFSVTTSNTINSISITD